MSLRRGLLLLSFLVAGCEEQHGFLKISSNVLLNDDDQLACGEAKIAPKPGGLLDAFVTLAPQDCALTLRRAGDVLWFGTKLCTVHIENNRITTVYLAESRDGVSCNLSRD